MKEKLAFLGPDWFSFGELKDVESAKTKEACGNGYVVKKGSSYTYQEGISKAKMEMLCRNAGLKVVSHVCNSSRHIIVVSK